MVLVGADAVEKAKGNIGACRWPSEESLRDGTICEAEDFAPGGNDYETFSLCE